MMYVQFSEFVHFDSSTDLLVVVGVNPLNERCIR